MQENKRSFRVRLEHKQLILEEAERNPVIITMDFSMPNARAHYNKSWEILTTRLNSLGYGEKSSDKWRRVLVDWVSSIKSKYTKIKNDMRKTGGGPLTEIHLNPHEERLMAIKGFTSVEGDGETPEIGLAGIPAERTNTNQTISAMNSIEVVNLPTNSTNFFDDGSLTITDHNYTIEDTSQSQCNAETEVVILSVEDGQKKRKRKEVTFQQKKNKTIEDMHEETLAELKSINFNLGAIADSMKSVCDYLKKI